MRTFKRPSFVFCVLLLACQQHEDSPDLATIASDYCAVVQMCDPGDMWESLEVCERYSAEEFERTRVENKECFDARVVMETCLGQFESCDEYTAFTRGDSRVCRGEFDEFYFTCLEP
jgi:hypothetical protein